jgi:hypothetical protein
VTLPCLSRRLVDHEVRSRSSAPPELLTVQLLQGAHGLDRQRGRAWHQLRFIMTTAPPVRPTPRAPWSRLESGRRALGRGNDQRDLRALPQWLSVLVRADTSGPGRDPSTNVGCAPTAMVGRPAIRDRRPLLPCDTEPGAGPPAGGRSTCRCTSPERSAAGGPGAPAPGTARCASVTGVCLGMPARSRASPCPMSSASGCTMGFTPVGCSGPRLQARRVVRRRLAAAHASPRPLVVAARGTKPGTCVLSGTWGCGALWQRRARHTGPQPGFCGCCTRGVRLDPRPQPTTPNRRTTAFSRNGFRPC